MSGPVPGVTGTTIVIARPGVCAQAMPIETVMTTTMVAHCSNSSNILLRASVPDGVIAVPLSACISASAVLQTSDGLHAGRKLYTGYIIAVSACADHRAAIARVILP